MTIPSRPAPAPPVNRGQTAADGANASIEQLRRQLEHQQMQQQQNGGAPKLTIKLPPPPKRPVNNGLSSNSYNINNNNNNHSNNSSITRKFPKARYAPATDWDDAPFDTVATSNGNFKKVPPPRPPPPKVQVNGRKVPGAPAASQPAGILHIFQRKKVIKSSSSNGAANRIYGVSSGTSVSSSSSVNTYTSTNSYSAANWNAAWNTNSQSASSLSSLATSSSHHSSTGAQDAQLISFDSPPSSPTFTQKSNSDCVSVDSFSSDSNFSSPQNGSVSQPESGFEDDFSAARSRPATTSPLDPWEALDVYNGSDYSSATAYSSQSIIGTAPVRNLSTINMRSLTANDNPLCNGKSLLPPTPSLNAPTIIKPKISQKPKAPKPPMLAKPYPYAGQSVDLPTPPSPPMPQCAPPPPPPSGVSLLDVITGKVDAIHLGAGAAYVDDATAQSAPYGVALYDFDGLEEGDLSFRENEKIYLLEQASEEWYRGRTRAGCEGIFPANYIDVKVPLAAPSAAKISATTLTHQQQPHSAGAYSGANHATQRIRCLYNFPAEVAGDLALKENDLVTVLYRINEDWLFGEIGGRQGQFPANFLEYVPDNIPLP